MNYNYITKIRKIFETAKYFTKYCIPTLNKQRYSQQATAKLATKFEEDLNRR